MRKKNFSLYTPSNTPPEDLLAIFVQRELFLDRIVERLARSMTDTQKHHILLVGPRGCGKTNLITLAQHKLRSMPELEKFMRIAWLGEDNVFTAPIDLALGIADQLATEYPEDFDLDFREKVYGLDPVQAAEAVLGLVVDRLGHRSLLLLTENLDRTLGNFGDMGRKRLRAFFQETRKISTLASSQQLFSEVSKREEVFFGFFDIHHLEPLDRNEALRLIQLIAREQGNDKLVRYAGTPEGRYRVRSLHHLAGGNHRMYVLLSEFLSKESLDDLVTAFEDLADEMTPYFQERLSSLPPQQARIIQCLCNARGSLTVKEVARNTFVAERNCSKQLGELKKKRYVRSDRRGKLSFYEMCEPLMRLCLQVKNAHGSPLRIVAKFLKAWYPEEKLKSIRLPREGEGDSRARLYIEEALSLPDEFSKKLARDIIDEIRQKKAAGKFQEVESLLAEMSSAKPSAYDSSALIDSRRTPPELQAKLLFSRGLQYQEQNETQKAIDEYSRLINMENAFPEARARALVNRGALYGEQLEVKKEIEDYSKLIEMVDAPPDPLAKAHLYRGHVFRHQGELQKAMSDFSRIIDLDIASPDQRAEALFSRGVIYGLRGDEQREIDDYSSLIEMEGVSPKYRARAIFNRGALYGKKGEVQKEIGDYSQLIGLDHAPPNLCAMALFNRGCDFLNKGDFHKAIEDYSRIIEMPEAPAEQQARALFNRGNTYKKQKDFDRSIHDFSQLIDMENAPKDHHAKALYSRADIYQQLDNFESAINDFSSIIELEKLPVDWLVTSIFNRGVAFARKGEVKDAINDFSVIIDKNDAPPGFRADSLFNRGVAHWTQNEKQNAIEDFSQLINMKDLRADQRAMAIVNRGVLYGQQEKIKKEIEDYSMLIAIDDAPPAQLAKALFNRGVVYRNQGEVNMAIRDFSRLIRLETAPPEEIAKALNYRGSTYWNIGKYPSALSDFEKVLSDFPDHTQQIAIARFAKVEAIIPLSGLDDSWTALNEAFELTKPDLEEFGGWPSDILREVLKRGPIEWPAFISRLGALYIEHNVAEKLGKGIVETIRDLAGGGFSSSQRQIWHKAWHECAISCDDLKLPLRCLKAAIEVIDTGDDQALLRLPSEIRSVIKPLLSRVLESQSG